VTKVSATQAIASVITAVGLGIASFLSPASANADACGEVCITDLRTNGSIMHVTWNGNPRFTEYVVYWQEASAGVDSPVFVPGNQFAFDIPGVKPGETYTVTVAGCTPHIPIFATSRCGGPHDERTITV
jgi:hypothetical protein